MSNYLILCNEKVFKWHKSSYLFFQDAKSKFQLLQKVISILGDEEKRATYDQTGITDDDVSDSFAKNLAYLPS